MIKGRGVTLVFLPIAGSSVSLGGGILVNIGRVEIEKDMLDLEDELGIGIGRVRAGGIDKWKAKVGMRKVME